jgi:CCR4-NOT transcriptional regulation complex NOT5 subunit
MRTVILYSTDKMEAVEGINHTPIVSNENGSLTIAILTEEQEANLVGMESLGTYEELFASLDALTKYKSVYPYDVSLSYTDDEGNTVEYYLPEKIGVFA